MFPEQQKNDRGGCFICAYKDKRPDCVCLLTNPSVTQEEVHLSPKDTKIYSPIVHANPNYWPFSSSFLLTLFQVLAYARGLWHLLGGLLYLFPLWCVWSPFQHCQRNVLQVPSVCTQAPSCFLPHSFTLVNFLSSLCLFMAHIPGRSYFHIVMQHAWLAKATACVGNQFSLPLSLPGSLLSPPISTCSKLTA